MVMLDAHPPVKMIIIYIFNNIWFEAMILLVMWSGGISISNVDFLEITAPSQ